MATVNDESVATRVTTLSSNIIGSWWMIGAETLVIVIWFWLNLSPRSPVVPFDNTRFDTLRLILSIQAVYTTPLLLMAQRRVGAKDRAVLHDIMHAEDAAGELRREAMERRIRTEKKLDELLERLQKQ